MIVVEHASDDETVIEFNIGDRRMRLCRCSKCAAVSRCTPTNDFYTAYADRKNPAAALTCEVCFRGGLNARGIHTDDMPRVS